MNDGFVFSSQLNVSKIDKSAQPISGLIRDGHTSSPSKHT